MLDGLFNAMAWLAGLGAAVAAIEPAYLDRLLNPNRYEFYALPLLLAVGAYAVWKLSLERQSQLVKANAVEAGLDQPPSLHPLIDPGKCIGCGACVRACPEGRILGLINDKAELIEPASCIGHGACKTSCPTGAITLVFGTATRGIEIPHVSPTFEANVPGLFIAGELGGMGLIANAVEQGRQAVAAIAKLEGVGAGRSEPDQLDLIVVGAGPAGISASLAAREHRLRTLTLEQETLGGTVSHYPRGKIVMTRPAMLPLHGKVGFRRVRKERLIALWSDVVRRHRLPIRYGERVNRVTPEAGGFLVETGSGIYRSRTVLLALGRRGSPRKLGVPGETLPKVVYNLMEPRQYRGQRVLVVGGGDMALETAATLAVEGAAVTLSYRGHAFSRPRVANRQRLEALATRGRIATMLESEVAAIYSDHVDVRWGGRIVSVPNDAVIVCAGGVPPGAFLASVGVEVEMKYGTA